MERYQQARERNLQVLKDRGLEILSDWNGQTAIGKKALPIPVTVRQKRCGHTFTSSSKNLLHRGINCSVCGKKERTAYINEWSDRNSREWKKTASEWKKYRSAVTKHTRVTYKANIVTINPLNLPFGRCGTDGAYQLDHIIPVRYGFDNGIPPEQLANVSNLRVIPWLENVVKRDRLV